MSRYWLMKTEPDVFSIDDLADKNQVPWEGVRNYQARNFMRDQFEVGDKVLIYHSNANPPGVAGIATVAKKAYPDTFALDKKSKYFDPKATVEKNPWVMVEVRFVKKLARLISLNELKEQADLKEMRLLQRGNRLSVMPIEKNEFEYIVKMAEE